METAREANKAELKDAESKRDLDVKNIVHNHVLWSMGVGIVPLPIFDIIGIMGLQLRMIHELSKTYNVPFAENRVKSIISSLLGGLGANGLATGAVGSFLKIIPLVGQTLGALSMPLFAGASTYALGKVFVQHFESGGTFLDFDPKKVKEYFAEQFEKGKLMAKDLKEKRK